jgi:hypothetical protein
VKTTRLRIEGQDFYLAPETEVEKLKDAAVAAIREGGGIIDFMGIEGRVISVLLSPGVAVLFEAIERPDVSDDDSDEPGHDYNRDDFGH